MPHVPENIMSEGPTAAKTYTTAASTRSWRTPTCAARLTCGPGGCAPSQPVTTGRASSSRKTPPGPSPTTSR